MLIYLRMFEETKFLLNKLEGANSSRDKHYS